MGNFSAALEKLANSFEEFADNIRNMHADEAPPNVVNLAGYGEEPDDVADEGDERPAPREDLDDDTVIKLRSGDLRKVVDAYRKLSRLARNGQIPTQEERFKLHRHIKAVKHLIRRPHR